MLPNAVKTMQNSKTKGGYFKSVRTYIPDKIIINTPYECVKCYEDVSYKRDFVDRL